MKDQFSFIQALPKTGNERLSVNGEKMRHSLLDFWQWSVSDILSNATRGRFAEFIVGASLGLNSTELRDEWAPFDLLSDGMKIEIKSAAYIQSWHQNKLSDISFSIRTSRSWNSKTGIYDAETKRQADVYVFCLLKHIDQETIDPLKLEQWDFFVLPTHQLDGYPGSQHTMTLHSLRKLTDAVDFNNLESKIRKQYDEQKSIVSNILPYSQTVLAPTPPKEETKTAINSKSNI